MIKKLQSLSLRREFDINRQSEIKKFNEEFFCLIYFFTRLLKEYSWPSPYSYISISLGKQEYEFNSKIYEKGIKLDFTSFYEKNRNERQTLILNILVDVFERISEINKLEINIILKIKQEIYKAKFRNIFFIKNKLFRSPNQKLFAGLNCHCLEKKAIIYIELYGKDKKTLIKKELLLEIPSSEIEVLNMMMPKWLDNKTFLINNQDKAFTFIKTVGSIKIVN